MGPLVTGVKPPKFFVHPRTLGRHSRAWHGVALAAIGFLIWLISAPTVHAQVLYEWREPAGTVAYSQMPPGPEDGVLLRSLKLADLPAGDRSTAARVVATSAPRSDGHASAWRRADAKVATALARLQSAERAARAGQQPRAGERRRLVNGHSRLSSAYFDRLSALDATVRRARDALQAAYAERDALANPR